MPADVPAPLLRTRRDRCPGVVAPWPAADGGLVRVRVPGGRVSLGALHALAEVAARHGDGRVRLTGRANLQLRAMPLDRDLLAGTALAAIEATGLVPSREHDRARNVLVSPQTGLAGGRADLRPVAQRLDALLLATPALAALPGRFLFTLDDGRGDLADRHRDLGLVALDGRRAQLVVGTGFGDVVDLTRAAARLTDLAAQFLRVRGTGPDAPWHVTELATPLAPAVPPAPGADVVAPALPHGPVAGGTHVPVDDDGLDLATVAAWLRERGPASIVVVTPWHGVLLPEEAA